jgi:hypothetical protein
MSGSSSCVALAVMFATSSSSCRANASSSSSSFIRSHACETAANAVPSAATKQVTTSVSFTWVG